MIGKIASLALLGFSSVYSIYKAGKFANGGKDVSEGPGAAVGSLIGAAITALVAFALYLDL